jgi:hypothetical protein
MARRSIKSGVSKRKRLLAVSCERQLAGVLAHQAFESLESHNFPERQIYRIGARLDNGTRQRWCYPVWNAISTRVFVSGRPHDNVLYG